MTLQGSSETFQGDFIHPNREFGCNKQEIGNFVGKSLISYKLIIYSSLFLLTTGVKYRVYWGYITFISRGVPFCKGRNGGILHPLEPRHLYDLQRFLMDEDFQFLVDTLR